MPLLAAIGGGVVLLNAIVTLQNTWSLKAISDQLETIGTVTIKEEEEEETPRV